MITVTDYGNPIKDKFEKLIKTPDYKFLESNQDIKDILFLTVGGSYAYGTNVDTSDFDLRGVCFKSDNSLLGLDKFEQFEDRNTDTVIYSLEKFISLLINCNPNTIELLGCDNHLDDEYKCYGHFNSVYFNCSLMGEELIDNAHLFLSQRAFYSFTGYASAQLRRLENNIARYSVTQERKEEHIKDSIMNILYSLNERYKQLNEKNNFELYIDNSDKTDMDKEIFIKGHFEGYPLRDFNGIYSEMNNVVKEYEKLGKRNSKKDDLHLNKHMMHLVRLYLTGIDIFEKELIITNRTKDLELLMSIRNGKFLNADGTLNESFMDLINELEKKINYAKENTSLPPEPNYKKINSLLKNLNKSIIIKRLNDGLNGR